jgi:hypothetical protein
MEFVLAMLLAAVIQVRVTTVDGVTNDVDLLGVNAVGLEIESGGQTKTVAFDNLLSMTRTTSASIAPPVMRAELSNGSRIAISGVTSDGETAILNLREQQPLSIPIKQVRWLRFRSSSATVDPQWLGMIDKARTTDVLVVRRAGDALDEVEGIVKSITAKVVTVDLDGEDLPAPLEKLEGVLFANATAVAPAGKILVEDTVGSRWQARSLSPGANNAILLELGGGVTHEIPLAQLRKIEATGSVQYLASESPAESSFVAVSKVGLGDALASQWFEAKSDNGRDLVMHADSFVEYRLDETFSTIAGTVQFDPTVTAGGTCSLKILLDGKAVWDQTFDVKDPSPKGYELPIGAAKRVRFDVKSAGDGDLGDTLRLRQPRLVK